MESLSRNQLTVLDAAQKTPILRVIFLQIQTAVEATIRMEISGFKSDNIDLILNDWSLNSCIYNSRPVFPPGSCFHLFTQHKT